MAKQGHLSKGRVKRPALQVGSFSGKRIRVKKEKAPTKFISNADKGGDVTVLSRWGAAGRDLRGARVVADSDSEDGGEAKRKQAHQLQLEKTRIDGLNRTERRQRERRQQNRDPVISSYYEGLQAEKRLSDEQKEVLRERRAAKQGGWMKYNYHATHPSWLASIHRRRELQKKLDQCNIHIFDDNRREDADATGGGGGPQTVAGLDEDEEEEVEEFEEVEEGSDDAGKPEPYYPSFAPVRKHYARIDPNAEDAAELKKEADFGGDWFQRVESNVHTEAPVAIAPIRSHCVHVGTLDTEHHESAVVDDNAMPSIELDEREVEEQQEGEEVEGAGEEPEMRDEVEAECTSRETSIEISSFA
ncbi:hypothetical protein DIPPA_07371 [Diplonema papillatum]|nr:hypothetical protein DIPPA_07371 [Diplonema papillatum]